MGRFTCSIQRPTGVQYGHLFPAGKPPIFVASSLHRIQADEVWHFYAGAPLEIFVIDTTGMLTVIRLGNKPDQGDVFQAVVSAGCWFGSKPVKLETAQQSAFSLVGCTVAPGFDFADFELADRATLLNQFPQHRQVIEMLTT